MAERRPLQETSFMSRSQSSIGRFSERDLHREYSVDYKEGRFESRLLLGNVDFVCFTGTCDACLTRIPYATLIATIMCALGVVVFCATMYRGATLAILMFDEVFKMRILWVEAVQMTFVIIGACMGALGLMILTVGCLATGATRQKVYRAWRSRVGGRISCAVVSNSTVIT